MKNILILTLSASLLVSTSAFSFEAKLADGLWNGNTVPAGQQCQKFGGINPSTPKLVVLDIPDNTNEIVLEYSDRDSKRMNNGGHGKMSFSLPSHAMKVVIPSVPGHTFKMPAGFKMIEAHRGAGWDKAGAYMPPCSGGKGHAYYVTVKAVSGNKVIATSTVEMGKY